ncbi:MAG: heavy metal-responsive transcriptional regulator [Intrasporangium sp.]|uniref:heavy metal-responsive transcriptional regulator n=1 Tax=Intrasporangium sp. TaxID=1925024 RepID=UPI00264746CA|nr:heavy metal-responsive transcriptional regulator [Intrasporangium sp.]MDN5797564.1 heavy metal-responsive transcriptional regulator [Intrasporangium sp.]
MLIGELAEAVGLPSQTIRFYERKGLMPAPARGGNGYRSYDDSAVTCVKFIRTAQAAGLTLVQIRSIVDLRDQGARPCTHVTELIEGKLVEVRRRMGELAALEKELEQLRERSQRLDPADCTDTDICHILAARNYKRRTPTNGRMPAPRTTQATDKHPGGPEDD